MSGKKKLTELVNHVVKSTQHVVLIDPATLLPSSGGSGCLIVYRERLFFVSVQHVADKEAKQVAIETGRKSKTGTELFSLPAMNFVDQYRIETDGMDAKLVEELRALDICYTEIKDSIDIEQKAIAFGDIKVTKGKKRMLYTNLDYIPADDEGFCFYGRIRAKLEGGKLEQTDKLVLGMKYDGKIGAYERFVLQDEIKDPLDYKGTSGAPIISESGEPVALVAHGMAGEKYIYGFSMRELKKYLEIYLDLNPDESDDGKEMDSGDSLVHFSKSISRDNFEMDSDFDSGTLGFITTKNIKNPNESTEKYISYPVLFGTNRKAIQKNGKLAYNNERDDKMHLGQCKISIPRSHKTGELERPGWFRRLFFDESPEKHFTILSAEELKEAQFETFLRERVSGSDEKDMLLFIHGFNVDFQEAMFRSAQLGYDLSFKGAVTAYSWPSVGSVAGYVADTDSARLSAGYLCKYLEILLQTEGLKKLHIIAHSMGNVVLTQALLQMKKNGKFPNATINQIILAAPDIDRDIFLQEIMPEIKGDYGFTLYASDKDNALIASRTIRTGYVRLGEGGENITIVDGLVSVDASDVDTSLLGHGYFADTQSLLSDIHMTLQGLQPDNRLLEKKSKVVGGEPKPYWMFRRS